MSKQIPQPSIFEGIQAYVDAVTCGEIDDPVTLFAAKTLRGDYVAGLHVRDACARHLRDLEHGADRGLVWDLQAVHRAIGYFREVLCLNGGEYEGEPFNPNPWQCFVIGSLHGWRARDGYRRFRVAYVETAKGSGKSPLAAGMGLYGLTADGEARAEVYAAATKKDQAMILFRDAVAMVDQSPLLNDRIEKSGRGEKVWNLAYPAAGSFFRPISADDGQSGPRPHTALLDEIHEHKSRTVVEMMRAGTKNRRQALIFMITNSGVNKTSVCWEYHEYGCRVSAGLVEDDSFFAFICGIDEGDDPFKDESCWPKANPSLQFGREGEENGGVPGYKYLREQVTEAKGMPGKESTVRRLNFCQWVEAASPWIGADVWLGCKDDPVDDALLEDRRAWGGLDLSSTQDLTAFTLIFEPVEHDPFWRTRAWFWLPGDGLHEKAERDRVPYLAWRDAGHLIALPGRAINKLAVLHQLHQIAGLYDIQGIAYDRWRIEDLNSLMGNEGVSLPNLEPFGQGFKDMGPAIDELERRLLDRELKHEGNPVLTWCAANAITNSDPAGNRKIAKDKATGRVDGIVALTMATGLASREPAKEESVYEQRGVLLF
ncbi:terminase large subunit [Pusillimonas sp. DMV24BSW_D]|uniref:terminase large subunit n=1 Tax=Neopusillimonas aestuarii TaxID=2716226 RepID=UPI00140BEC6D|nr:terminase TerL endonuclease subunit [Pusillimonas sp. DMV24BSW_D]QIM48980.1 terminase large subunit [Pusillimonas sp. DMV24BSW_D]